MKKLFALFLLMAMPASAAVIVTGPTVASVPGTAWARTPLKDGGYARCKNPSGCRTWTAPHNEIVAQYGNIYEGVLFDGWSASLDGSPPVPFLVVHPLGFKDTPHSGIYSLLDDWEGVTPIPVAG